MARQPHRTNADKAKVEERRLLVASGMLSGQSYRAMADVLGVDKSTIQRDTKTIFQRWQDEQIELVHQQRLLQLARLNRLINALWDAAASGNPNAIDRILKIMRRQADVVGLDKPSKVDPNGETSWTPKPKPKLDLSKLSLQEKETLHDLVEKAQPDSE